MKIENLIWQIQRVMIVHCCQVMIFVVIRLNGGNALVCVICVLYTVSYFHYRGRITASGAQDMHAEYYSSGELANKPFNTLGWMWIVFKMWNSACTQPCQSLGRIQLASFLVPNCG